MVTKYSFEDVLSPYDFEILIKDLLSYDLGVELVSFAEGADGGVDLRCLGNKDKKIIVQCRRTKNLSKDVLDDECEKVSKLNFNKYYLATSNEISVKKSDYILEKFSRWMKDGSHLYAKSRINSLLDKYPQLLRRHYKLWLNSSEVFDQFINNDLLGRSSFLIEDISNSLKFYVRNNSYNYAVDILNKHKFIIISGIPGIGKSTLWIGYS